MLSFPQTVVQRMDEQKIESQKTLGRFNNVHERKKLSQTWQQQQLTKNGTADENLFSFLIVDDFFSVVFTFLDESKLTRGERNDINVPKK